MNELTLPARLMVVDDHPLVREGIAARMATETDLEICGEAETEEEAFAMSKELMPDLIIVDISLRTGNGIDLIKRIHAIHPTMKMVVVSMFQESIYAERALRAGAMGYLNKRESDVNLLSAIRTVLGGQRYVSDVITRQLVDHALNHDGKVQNPIERLTDRELEIFRLIGQGLSSGAIADQLFLSSHTIDTHRENLKRKLGVKNAAQLNRQAMIWTLENN